MGIWKKIIIILGVIIALFVVLNINYFKANFGFFARRPQLAYEAEHQPAQPTMAPNTLAIPSLGISAPIVYATGTTETAFQAALINGVAHYPNTADPGKLGNCYIFGHSSDFIWSKGKYKNVFATLPQIQKGAEIYISSRTGEKFTYLVTQSFAVSANDTSVLSQQGNVKKLLTLQTSYPVGTAIARWVVAAEIK